MTTTTTIQVPVHAIKGGDRLFVRGQWREVYDVAQRDLRGRWAVDVHAGHTFLRVYFRSLDEIVEVA